MSEHPIQALMTTAMQNIKDMVDVNTIVGDAVQTPDGTMIIPISRVSCGFGAGGSEIPNVSGAQTLPFGGGSGGGFTVNPVAFLVCGQGYVKLMPVEQSSPFDKAIEYIPELIDKVQAAFSKKKDGCCTDDKGHSCDCKEEDGKNADKD